MSLSYDNTRKRNNSKPRHSPKKARKEHWHAKQRARERYGLFLTTTQMHRLVDDIRNGLSLKEWRQSCRRSKHIIWCQGQQVLVVFDNKRGEIVTFLPLDRKVTDA